MKKCEKMIFVLLLITLMFASIGSVVSAEEINNAESNLNEPMGPFSYEKAYAYYSDGIFYDTREFWLAKDCYTWIIDVAYKGKVIDTANGAFIGCVLADKSIVFADVIYARSNAYPWNSTKDSITTAIQKTLIALRYNLGSSGADGYFGPATENAVLAFQSKNGLVADGVVGKNTYLKLSTYGR